MVTRGDRFSTSWPMPRGPAVRQGDGLGRADNNRRPGARQDLAMLQYMTTSNKPRIPIRGPAVRQGDDNPGSRMRPAFTGTTALVVNV